MPSLGAPTIHGLVDIDASVAGNPAHSPDYIDDIYSYLRQLEVTLTPKVYMCSYGPFNTIAISLTYLIHYPYAAEFSAET